MGRKVLITGGSRGIGAECVRVFRECGDDVAFLYRSDDAAALAVSGCGAYALKCDISDASAAADAVKTAIERLGGLDVLINCAGISQIGLFTDATDADIARMINTDLIGAMTVAREAAREMIRNHSGRIVNIGSMWGKTGASCEVAYSAAKAGLRGFTMALAKELGPSGITVNCVEPGFIDTEMNKNIDAQTRAELINETPMCRIGTPADVAAAVRFLCSDGAGFITGQILGVDGGFAV